MKCGYCREKLEAVLIPIGPGFQVSCSCGKCGAVWTYDIYSLRSMALVEKPTGLDQAIFDGVEPLPSLESIFEKCLGPLPELPES